MASSVASTVARKRGSGELLPVNAPVLRVWLNTASGLAVEKVCWSLIGVCADLRPTY